MLKEALAPLASKEAWVKSIEVASKALKVVKDNIDGGFEEDEDEQFLQDVYDLCLNPQSYCNLKKTDSQKHTFLSCESKYCRAKTYAKSIYGESYYSIRFEEGELIMFQYIVFEAENIYLENHPNSAVTFFLFMNREDALTKEETTSKPTGVTVHHLSVKKWKTGEWIHFHHDAGTNEGATEVPEGHALIFDMHDGLPPGYTKDYSKLNNMRYEGTPDNFISSGGMCYDGTLRRTLVRTITDKDEMVRIV